MRLMRPPARQFPRSLAVIVGSIALAACASSSGSAPAPSTTYERVHLNMPESAALDANIRVEHVESSNNVMASQERAWAAVREAYAALGIPVETADSAAHRVTSPQLRARGTFARRPLARLINCGSGALGPHANTYDVSIRVQSRVEQVNANTATVRSIVTAVGAAPGTGQGRTQCPSTGALETQIAEQVAQQLK